MYHTTKLKSDHVHDEVVLGCFLNVFKFVSQEEIELIVQILVFHI